MSSATQESQRARQNNPLLKGPASNLRVYQEPDCAGLLATRRPWFQALLDDLAKSGMATALNKSNLIFARTRLETPMIGRVDAERAVAS